MKTQTFIAQKLCAMVPCSQTIFCEDSQKKSDVRTQISPLRYYMNRVPPLLTHVNPISTGSEDVVGGLQILDDVVGSVDEKRTRHTIPRILEEEQTL